MTASVEHWGRLPVESGTYTLLLRLDASTQITVGKLGTFDFGTGWYAYVGSAFGPGGLRARLKHHLTPVKRPHWHIDYLRTAATVREVWYVADASIYEHRWAAALHSLPGATAPVPRFGASDCKCATHLVSFCKLPTVDDFRQHTKHSLQRYVLAGAT